MPFQLLISASLYTVFCGVQLLFFSSIVFFFLLNTFSNVHLAQKLQKQHKLNSIQCEA